MFIIDVISRTITNFIHGVNHICGIICMLPAAGAPVSFWLIALCATLMFVSINFFNPKILISSLRVIVNIAISSRNTQNITQIEALCFSLIGTFGIVSITAVATAIIKIGPGIIFWAFIFSLITTTAKYAEVSMASKYRDHIKDYGGPFAFLRAAFGMAGMDKAGIVTGYIFAFVLMLLAIAKGNVLVIDHTRTLINVVSPGLNLTYTFPLVAGIIATILMLGKKIMFKMSCLMGPTMLSICIIAAALAAFDNISLKNFINIVLHDAFADRGSVGGMLYMLSGAVTSSVVSNMPGVGFASIIHGAVNDANYIERGFIAALEHIINAVLLYLIIGMTIVAAMQQIPGQIDGQSLLLQVINMAGKGKPAVMLVVISSIAALNMFAAAYVGEIACKFICGDTFTQIFRILFICIMLACWYGPPIYGGIADMLSNMTMFLTMPGALSLYILTTEMRGDINRKMHVTGEIGRPGYSRL